MEGNVLLGTEDRNLFISSFRNLLLFVLLFLWMFKPGQSKRCTSASHCCPASLLVVSVASINFFVFVFFLSLKRQMDNDDK